MTITGTHGPHFKGERLEMVRGKVRRISRWEGTEAECKGLFPGLRNAADYASCDRIGDTPVWFTEAVFEGASSSDPNIVDTFELLFNTEQLPMEASQVLHGTSSSLLTMEQIKFVQNQLRALNEAVLDKTTGEPDFTYNQAVTRINTRHPGSAATMVKLLDITIKGVSSFFQDSPVLRFTRSFNWRVPQQPNYTNSNKVYLTTGALILAEGWTTPDIQLPAAQWFKKSPQYRLQYEGTGEIMYEYWGANEWVNILYAAAA